MTNEYEPPKTPLGKPKRPVGDSFSRGCLAFFLLGVASVIAFVTTCFPTIYVLDKTSGPSSGHLDFDDEIYGMLIAIVVGILVFVIGSIVLIVRWRSASNDDEDRQIGTG